MVQSDRGRSSSHLITAPRPVPASPLPPLPVIATGRYRHYKGALYQVLGVVRHSETLEPLVLYRPLGEDVGDWVRPYAMFVSTVVVAGREEPRFRRLDEG